VSASPIRTIRISVSYIIFRPVYEAIIILDYICLSEYVLTFDTIDRRGPTPIGRHPL